MSTPPIENPPPQPLEDWFLEILACPGCPERLPVRLNETRDALICTCGRYAYPIRDGIPILLVEEATVLNPEIPPGSAPR